MKLARRSTAALLGILLLAGVTACGNRASYESQLAAQQGTVQTGAEAGDDGALEPGEAVGSETPGVDPGTTGGTDVTAPTGTGGTTGGGSPGTVAPSAGGAPAKQCTGKEKDIIIGTVGHQSGVAGAALGGGPKAVQAWVAMINARGGLDCHKIQYIVADDGGDPARQQALVQQLVEQRKVVAFVGMNATLSGQSSIGYINSKRIPVVGTESASGWVYKHPMYFPQGSSDDLLIGGAFYALSEVGKATGKTKVAVVACVETVICSQVRDVGVKFAGPAGLTVTYTGSASLVQPDFTSQCLNAQRSGAEMLMLGFETNGLKRFAANCASVGYRPILATVASAAGADFPDDPNLDGMVVGMNVKPWFISSDPKIAEFRSALARFAPGVPASAGAVTGWVSAKLFEEVAVNLPDQPTSAAILENLWKIKDNDLGGLTGPITFTKDQNAPRQFCWWSAQVKGGEWTSPNGAKRTCQ